MLMRSELTDDTSHALPRRIERALDFSRQRPGERHRRVVDSPAPVDNARGRHCRADVIPADPAFKRSLLCIEDNEKCGTHLTAALRNRGYAVELARDGKAGLAKVLESQPDLVLCDIRVPGMSGLELLRRVAEAGPDFASVPFIFLTGCHDRDSELAARRLGADDFVSKPVDCEMLEVVIQNRLRRASIRRVSEPKLRLTEREKEVLTWVGRGKTSAEIAIILGLRERTVNFHCDNAMRRLDVTNRTQAVATAITQGLTCI